MLGAIPSRSITSSIKSSVSMIEFPAPASGSPSCRYVQIMSSVPALVLLSEHPVTPTKDKDGKDTGVLVSMGKGVIYIPPDVPVTVVSGQRIIYVRSLDKEGIFCAAPLASM